MRTHLLCKQGRLAAKELPALWTADDNAGLDYPVPRIAAGGIGHGLAQDSGVDGVIPRRRRVPTRTIRSADRRKGSPRSAR